MDTSTKRHILKFFFLYFNHYAFNVQIWPFLSMYLLSEGASAETVGVVFSISTVCAVLGSLLVGYIGDRVSHLSKMIASVIIGLLTATAFMWRQESVGGTLFWFYVTSLFYTGADVSLDSWAVGSRPECGRFYGIMRSGGSFGYFTFAAVAGFLIPHYGYDVMFLTATILAFVQMLYVFWLISFGKMGSVPSEKKPLLKEKPRMNLLSDIKALLGIRDYRHLLIIGFIIYLAGKFAEVFTPYFIMDSGGGVSQQAFFCIVAGTCDLPFFWLSPVLLRRFKLKHLVTAAAIAGLLRTGILAFVGSPEVAVVTAFFGTAQYAIFHPTIRYYVSRIVPENIKFSAQAVITIVSYSVSTILASFLGGKLVTLIGIHSAFLCAALVVASAMVMLAFGIVLKEDVQVEQGN